MVGSFGSIALNSIDRPTLERLKIVLYVGGGGAGVVGQWAQQLMLKR